MLSDVEPVVCVRAAGGGQALVPLCSALCTSVVEDGVPDVGVQNHVVEPRLGPDNTPLFHRYTVKPDPAMNGFAFVPDNIPMNSKVRHSELGAAFFMNGLSFQTTPKKHGHVLWEMSLDTVPPPTMNVLKPKFWLLGKIELAANKWYRLI